jgi:3alpha(or 20beta)-hydroxysteroid dehydrogenase
MGRLDGKVAIVTGAARGTGAAIAREFVAEGARTTLVDVLDDRGAATAAELGAEYRHVDVTSDDDWASVVAAVRAREGRIDVLVNNAAVMHLATIDMTTEEAFERVWRVNALGPFHGTRAVLPVMRAGGGGSIVNLGSIDSVTGTSLTSVYTMSKFALRGLTKVTALENSQFGVRANIVCPAAGNSEMHPPIVGWEDLQRPSGDGAPTGRGPDAVAPAAVYFASDESRLCNGVELVLDGGQTAGMLVPLPEKLFTPAG